MVVWNIWDGYGVSGVREESPGRVEGLGWM